MRPIVRPLLTVLFAAGWLVSTGCTAPSQPSGWTTFGAAVPADEALPLTAVLADPESFDGRHVLLEARIEECCPMKGCWLTLVDGDDTVRVTFKDYGFFVPLDSAGKTVRVDGTFGIRVVPVDEARHYLEDAGRPEEAAAITEPQRGYEIVATGVALHD